MENLDTIYRAIEKNIDQIRDYINSPRLQFILMSKVKDWHLVCSSLDTLGDSSFAVKSYNNMHYPENVGERYLLLYGTLQALFLQRDAVKHIAESFNFTISNQPNIKQAIEARNNAIGHPTKRNTNPVTHHFLNRRSISRNSYEIMTVSSAWNDARIKEINIKSLISGHNQAICIQLDEILTALKEMEKTHMSQHSKTKLESLIPKTLDYSFGKVSEALRPDGHLYISISKAELRFIVKCYSEFRNELEKRGELPANDWIEYCIAKIEYPLTAVEEYFEDSQQSRLNYKDAQIFMSFARSMHDDLVEIARQIDGDYENGSEP
ncbi:hypothetical protein ACWPKO_12290 [Coraliomargarita sp. W4R53]